MERKIVNGLSITKTDRQREKKDRERRKLTKMDRQTQKQTTKMERKIDIEIQIGLTEIETSLWGICSLLLITSLQMDRNNYK